MVDSRDNFQRCTNATSACRKVCINKLGAAHLNLSIPSLKCRARRLLKRTVKSFVGTEDREKITAPSVIVIPDDSLLHLGEFNKTRGYFYRVSPVRDFIVILRQRASFRIYSIRQKKKSANIARTLPHIYTVSAQNSHFSDTLALLFYISISQASVRPCYVLRIDINLRLLYPMCGQIRVRTKISYPSYLYHCSVTQWKVYLHDHYSVKLHLIHALFIYF